jgi:hypothetical protein
MKITLNKHDTSPRQQWRLCSPVQPPSPTLNRALSEQIPATECSCQTSQLLKRRITTLEHQILRDTETHAAQLGSLRQENRDLRQSQEDTRIDESRVPTPQVTAGPALGSPSSQEQTALNHILRIDDPQQAVGLLGHILSSSAPADPIKTIHPSLPRYLTSQDSTSLFRVDMPAKNERLAKACLNLIHVPLQRDVCHLGDLRNTANRDVPDLADRLAQYVALQVLYACRFWAPHIQAVADRANVLPLIQRFYEEDLLHWIEVMSLHGRVGEAISCLRSMVSWIEPSSKDSSAPSAARTVFALRRPSQN